MFCLGDDTEAPAVAIIDIIQIIFIIVIFLFLVFLLKRSKQKMRAMINPRIGATYDETYCELSVLLLKLTQISILIMMGNMGLQLTKILMGTHYIYYF